MPLLDEIRAKRTEILAIAERCGLTDIKIFGSVARGEERPDSDVDFLVTADPKNIKGIETFGFPSDVAALIGRKVDMVFEKGLRPTVRKYVIKDMVPL
jgi:predicted nucleotidyltransferase